MSYVAEGNILDIDPQSFGGIGVFAIPNFARFYRHVLIGKRFPHHGAVAFDHCGKALFDAVKLLGVDDINVPLPKTHAVSGREPVRVASLEAEREVPLLRPAEPDHSAPPAWPGGQV